MNIPLIEDVGNFQWPSRRSVMDGEPAAISGLWLSAKPEDSRRLLEEMAEALRNHVWLLMGTWYGKRGGALPVGFESRYPGLPAQMIARNESDGPRGLVALSEWCVANPSSEYLFEFLESLRRSRGKGGGAVVAEADCSLRSWFALSMGSLWRASVAMELEDSGGHEGIHDSISWLQMVEMSERGYFPLVPLDLHPEGGFALLGNNLRLSRISQIVGERLQGFPLISSREVFDRGGGLAL